jgi:multiple sugar transport system substrate-binding protein
MTTEERQEYDMIRRATAAAATVLVALVAACGGDDGGDERQSVTMWIYPVIADEVAHRTFWDDTVAAFTAENPDVDVTVEVFPWADRDQALTTAIAGNQAPDVVYLIPDQIPGYANAIEPFDSYLDEGSRADYLPNVVESVSMEGQMMGAPILTSALSLICNRTVFEDAGVTEYPSTWDDFAALGPQFDAAGYELLHYDGGLQTALNLTFYPLLWQAGGDVFSPDGGTVAFNQEPGVRALTFLADLVAAGYVDEGPITTSPAIEQSRIAQGEVACVWSMIPSDVSQFWGEENVVVLPPLTDAEQVTYGTVGSLVMLNSADDKDAAAAWINFATATDQMREYDVASGYFSPRTSTGPLYDGVPLQEEAEQAVQFATVGPLHERARDVMGALAPEIQSALLGDKTPEQALNDAADAANAVLG